jgi:hypothetical protein
VFRLGLQRSEEAVDAALQDLAAESLESARDHPLAMTSCRSLLFERHLNADNAPAHRVGLAASLWKSNASADGAARSGPLWLTAAVSEDSLYLVEVLSAVLAAGKV